MGGSVYSPGRRLLMAAWGVWEAVWVRAARLYEIPGDTQRIIRIGFRRWGGPPVRLAGGGSVRRGDWVGEVHLNNRRWAQLWEQARGHPARAVAAAAAEMRAALRALSREVERGRLPVTPVALFGKTVIDRGLGRLGFEVQPLADTLAHRWLARYARWLVAVYHPGGWAHARERTRLCCAWLPTEELLRRYGTAAPPDLTTGRRPPGRPTGLPT